MNMSEYQSSRRSLSALFGPVLRRVVFPVPRHLAQRQIQLDEERLQTIAVAIRDRYLPHQGSDIPGDESQDRELADHLLGRLEIARRGVVPWLDSVGALLGQRILEIGCGTGASTVALAEQGAQVIAVDADEASMGVARIRCEAYELPVTFHAMNATEILTKLGGTIFDSVVFYASLEHMKLEERLTSLRAAWDLLADGGVLVVVETPNRLWHSDHHTSLLPFFHWLPEELAFLYAKYSPRKNFAELYADYSNEKEREHFVRRGRGVSFHEFVIALGPQKGLNVVSSWSIFRGRWFRLKLSRADRRYMRLLASLCPGLHEGFLCRDLYLAIRK